MADSETHAFDPYDALQTLRSEEHRNVASRYGALGDAEGDMDEQVGPGAGGW